jgi:hypothetical protein
MEEYCATNAAMKVRFFPGRQNGALAEMVLLRRFERPVIKVRFLEVPRWLVAQWSE